MTRCSAIILVATRWKSVEYWFKICIVCFSSLHIFHLENGDSVCGNLQSCRTLFLKLDYLDHNLQRISISQSVRETTDHTWFSLQLETVEKKVKFRDLESVGQRHDVRHSQWRHSMIMHDFLCDCNSSVCSIFHPLRDIRKTRKMPPFSPWKWKSISRRIATALRPFH